MIRVLVAAPAAVARAGLAALLETDERVHVAGSVASLTAALARAPDLEPDVIVAEANGAGLERLGEWPLVLLVEDPVDAGALLRAGARAVLARQAGTEELLATVQAVAAGLLVLHPGDFEQLLSPAARPPASSEPELLTPRELEVLRMMADGLGNKQIAGLLAISDHTAKFHVASVMHKLGATSRTEAVTVGIRRGLVLV